MPEPRSLVIAAVAGRWSRTHSGCSRRSGRSPTREVVLTLGVVVAAAGVVVVVGDVRALAGGACIRLRVA